MPNFLQWTVPLPVAAAPQTEQSLSSILTGSFGSVPTQFSGAYVTYYNAAQLASSDFRYWNPGSPTVGTWYVNGADIGGGFNHQTYVPSVSFGSTIFQAGNDIGPLAYVTVPASSTSSSSATYIQYSIITIDPSLISPTAGYGEPSAADIVASAYRFNNHYGFVVNDNDCHFIDAAVAAAAGATLTDNTQNLSPALNEEGGFWRIAYRGSQANPVSNWQTLVKPGDIVRMGWTATGGPHTTLVLAVNPDGSIVVYDNGNYVNGVEGIGIHTVNYDQLTIASDITIYRLTTDGLYLETGNSAGDCLPGTIFNDKIVGGIGNDALYGGPGNDIFQDQRGSNVIDGGGGRNVVNYAIATNQANLTHNLDGSWTVAIGATETDTLTNVEVLQFSDKTIALRDGPHFDVSGNGTSDILLFSGNSVIDWLVSNGSYSSYNPIGNISGYQAVGSGDFNGDGTSDILLKNSNGTATDLIMQNGVHQSSINIGNTAAYNIVGTGDFNADGTTDVLLQNASGNVIDWRMQNGSYQGYDNIGGAGAYGVVGTGNFNGDGTAGILLQNNVGNLIDWTIHNGTFAGWNQIGNPASAGYGVIGQGDFNGDGTTDILLENGSGNVIDWIMKNGVYAGWNEIGNTSGYGIVATGDYNGDGTTDVLLENSGQNIIDWTMQNGTFSGWHGVGNASGYTVSKT